MKERYTNYWQICREEAKISRNDVALVIEKSMETIGAYERGETLVPPEIALVLEDLYRKPGAALEYLRLTNPIAAKYLPEIKGGLLENAVQLNLSAQEIIDNSNNLLKAAIDGTLLNDSPEMLKKSHAVFMQVMASVMSILPQMIAAGITG